MTDRVTTIAPPAADNQRPEGPRWSDWDRYLAEWERRHGGYNPSKAPPPLRWWLRTAYRIATAARSAGIRTSAVTAAGLLLSLGVVAVAARGGGWPILAALLLAASAVAGSVEGALVAVSGRVSRLDQIHTALVDRLSEACWLVALAALGAAPWLAATCGGLTWLHEYLRARTGAVGVVPPESVTVGERPTRALVAGFALYFAGVASLAGPELPVGTVTAACAIWAVLQATALLQLLASVHDELSRQA